MPTTHAPESYKTAFGSFLKADDVIRQPRAATIRAVQREEIRSDRGAESKFVASFDVLEKRLILNRTNCDTLAQITGSEAPSEWAGVRVVIYTEQTLFSGRPVPGIRLRKARGDE